MLVENAVRGEPGDVFIGNRVDIFKRALHQSATLGAFHEIAHHAQAMWAEDVFFLEIERPQTSDIHVGPDAAVLVEQLVAEEIREGRQRTFSDTSLQILAS